MRVRGSGWVNPTRPGMERDVQWPGPRLAERALPSGRTPRVSPPQQRKRPSPASGPSLQSRGPGQWSPSPCPHRHGQAGAIGAGRKAPSAASSPEHTVHNPAINVRLSRGVSSPAGEDNAPPVHRPACDCSSEGCSHQGRSSDGWMGVLRWGYDSVAE